MDPRDFTTAEAARVRPVEAWATPEGDVFVRVDAATAREIAAAWGAWHATSAVNSDGRPRWHDDVVTLLAAAAHADVEAGTARIVDPDGYVLRAVAP